MAGAVEWTHVGRFAEKITYTDLSYTKVVPEWKQVEHLLALKTFIVENNIDIENHFIEKSYISIPYIQIYFTKNTQNY